MERCGCLLAEYSPKLYNRLNSSYIFLQLPKCLTCGAWINRAESRFQWLHVMISSGIAAEWRFFVLKPRCAANETAAWLVIHQVLKTICGIESCGSNVDGGHFRECEPACLPLLAFACISLQLLACICLLASACICLHSTHFQSPAQLFQASCLHFSDNIRRSTAD